MSDSHRAIERLIFRYADRIDAGDFDGVADVLARAEVTMGGRVVARADRDAVRRIYETTTRRYQDGTPHTRHVVTNLTITVDDATERASADSTFTVYQSLADFPLQAIIVGRYRDRFVREAGEWRFAARAIVPELYGDLSRHLLIALKS
jgi:3-phenylpropionate/cinnamic acid dioxygenase small subunit